MSASSNIEFKRDTAGRFAPGVTVDALTRFRTKCQFDPFTGCVIWTGGTSAGRGNTTRYGRFRDGAVTWYAHRWAAVYIHRLDVGHLTVAHCCPHGHNSLCVQHLAVETLAVNVAERNTRIAAQARQTNQERQYWLLVERGYEPLEPVTSTPNELPWYSPPEWLGVEPVSEDCPF